MIFANPPEAGVIIALLLAATPSSAAEAPSWLRQAVVDTGSVSSHAVVLLDDHEITITEDGKLRTRRRYAVRVNSEDGRDAALLRHVYINPGGKVRDIRGWMIRAGGGLQELRDDYAVDVAAVNNDVYNEVRVRAIGAIRDVRAREVFAAEIETEERLLFAQLEWPLQERWPVRLARRSLRLPAGWRASSVTFNAAALQPTSESGSLVWEARDLPEIAEEPGMPPRSALAARLAVSLYGPSGSRASGQFESWEEVAEWLRALSDPSAQPGEAVTTKAGELTANMRTDFDRVRAIGRYVQSVQYVSIQTGLGRGGGYQPRPPALVLTRNYGDCKDKASLMRAMLTAVGVRSYLVSIYSGDRDYVRAEWPSPQQFNHAIIAVSLREMPEGASTIEHETLGRLLMFDPTDEHIPVGELPLHEQGSLALIVAKGGGLRRMPVAPVDRHGIERTIDASLDAKGGVVAKVRETLRGADAARGRAERHAVDSATYRQHVERNLARLLPGARVTALEARTEDASFMTTEVTIRSPSHAQMTGNLMIVKPLIGADHLAMPAASSRGYPFVQEPIRREETVRLTLPTGMVVDEVARPVTIEDTFGRYALDYRVEDGTIVVRRTLAIPLSAIAPADQPRLREFLGRIRSADQSPIVLVRR